MERGLKRRGGKAKDFKVGTAIVAMAVMMACKSSLSGRRRWVSFCFSCFSWLNMVNGNYCGYLECHPYIA